MHWKKKIAPIVIGGIILLCLVGWMIAFDAGTPSPVVEKIIVSVCGAALSGVTVYVTVQRLKEIRSGEEDDLGKY